MGTTLFQTDLNTRDLLAQELAPYHVVMWRHTGDSVAVAIKVPVSDMSTAFYDLPEGATHAVIPVIVKGRGIVGTGRRSVDWKDMSEQSGPYYTGGADAAFIAALSPLADNHGNAHAKAWRAEAVA